MENVFRDLATDHGYEFHQHCGAYINGKAYEHTKKLEVAAALVWAQNNNGSERPNIRAITRQCKVGWHFVNKVEMELQQYGRVLVPNDKIRQRNDVGPGSKTLDELDTFVILSLYHDEPSRSLRSYASWLHYFVGTVVSDSTLCRFFKEAFPFSAGLYRPNIIPYDKFKPDNCMKALEYFHVMAMINPYRLKFGDEKSLKGKEVTNRKVRRNPLTGEIPPLLVPSDFRNTYSLTGFCGIDRRSSAVFCSIHDDTNGAPEFAMQLELAASQGYFHRGDILVLDNATIHHGGENSVLEEWMWSTLGVFVLFLPPRAPELNPIELVWNTLVARLRNVPLQEIRAIGSDSAAIKSQHILSEITHGEVEKYFRKCNI